MNVKEIGKELMGKSLNSYHRRTGLTQLEENNKMQDGILNGILSQVDDAYIEKTEQSNVIHLEGSGDGVVVLDSVEGNTMVNIIKQNDYRIDNSVIYRQENSIRIKRNSSSSRHFAYLNINNMWKENTIYTMVYIVEKNTFTKQLELNNNTGAQFDPFLDNGFKNFIINGTGVFIDKLTTKPKSEWHSTPMLYCTLPDYDETNLDQYIDFKMIVLEGDWTDKEISPYFEGLQSSFEEKVNDEGKYEIEILLNNKNLIDNSKSYQSSYASWIPNIGSLNNVVKTDTYNATFSNRGVGFLVKDLKPNTQYTLSIPSLLTNNKLGYALYDNENSINNWNYHIQGQGNISTNKITFTTPNRKTVAVVGVYGNYDVLYNNGANDGTVVIGNYRKLQLEVGSKNTEFNLQKQNKIKLLLNEPLRGVDKFKDRLCIKDNKLVVERNNYSQEVIPNISYIPFIKNNSIVFAIDPKMTPIGIYGICNMFPTDNNGWSYIQSEESDNREFYQIYNNFHYIHIKKSRLSSNDVQGVNEWLSMNKVVFVYPLEEPYYEEVLNEYGEPILLEGYENGTVYIDSTIIPTTTVKYTPKMASFNTLKEVSDNNVMLTNDVNENIIPYMMEVDLMIMEKEMATPSLINQRKVKVSDMTSMQKRTQDMLERLIKGKTLSEQECKTRVTTYLNAGKITDAQAEELMLLIDEVYA